MLMTPESYLSCVSPTTPKNKSIGGSSQRKSALSKLAVSLPELDCSSSPTKTRTTKKRITSPTRKTVKKNVAFGSPVQPNPRRPSKISDKISAFNTEEFLPNWYGSSQPKSTTRKSQPAHYSAPAKPPTKVSTEKAMKMPSIPVLTPTKAARRSSTGTASTHKAARRSSTTTSRRRSSTSTFLLEDERFCKSKVFQVRLDAAATILQARIRGMLGRKAADRARLAAVEAEMVALQSTAATKIQRLVRRGLARFHRKVQILENQLAAIEDRRVRGLERVEKFRQRELAKIHKECGTETAQVVENEQILKQQIALADQLRKENKKLRKKGHKLARQMREMVHVNQQLEQQIIDYRANGEALKDIITVYEYDNPKWESVVKEAEAKIEQYKACIQERKERWASERIIMETFDESIRRMTNRIQKKCSDEQLVELVEAWSKTNPVFV